VRIIHSEDHRLRDAQTELSGGLLVPPFEHPGRLDLILRACAAQGHGAPEPPRRFGLDVASRLHDAGYLDFLATAWARWVADGYEGEAIPSCFPVRRMAQRVPSDIDGALGYYAFAAETSITEGTWQAAQAAMCCALTGADLVAEGARGVFAACRPPGHHAAKDLFGGYSFLNNAAIAAQRLRDRGAERVAVLDVDFHHGNGTQDIFYDRADVLFVSLHGAPEEAFPHYLGYANEIGAGAGEGFNLNLPLARGTGYDRWSKALMLALDRISRFGAQALVVSLGVDTFERDPISFFGLTSDDFARYGAVLGKAGLPTLFCMEGGYGVDEIGVNVANVLGGFESAAGQPG